MITEAQEKLAIEAIEKVKAGGTRAAIGLTPPQIIALVALCMALGDRVAELDPEGVGRHVL